jgi:hypothetical protein
LFRELCWGTCRCLRPDSACSGPGMRSSITGLTECRQAVRTLCNGPQGAKNLPISRPFGCTALLW